MNFSDFQENENNWLSFGDFIRFKNQIIFGLKL